MAPPVQSQVRQAYDVMQQARADSRKPNSERAAAYGELGKLFLAAESYGDAEPCFVNASALSRVRTRALTVLAVDDDALVLMSTELLLQGLGHKVLTATSARQALEILRRGEAFDLVITDEAMPNMRGSQLAEAVLAERPGLPIVLATGYAEPRSGEAPSLPRLEKPFSQSDLARVIDEVTRSRAR